MEKIGFIRDDGSEEFFIVEEQTCIGGVSYLLVSDSEEDEANAYILKDISEPDSDTASYTFVEDEEEQTAVFRVFREMMDDVDFEE